jgi:cell division protein FtsB
VSDIERRIQRYRLSRFGPHTQPLRRRLRWVWMAALAWIVWAGLLSEHSFFRLWRMERENARMQEELDQVEAEIKRLGQERTNADLKRERAERLLRERAGMARPGEIVYRIRGERIDSLASGRDRQP